MNTNRENIIGVVIVETVLERNGDLASSSIKYGRFFGHGDIDGNDPRVREAIYHYFQDKWEGGKQVWVLAYTDQNRMIIAPRRVHSLAKDFLFHYAKANGRKTSKLSKAAWRFTTAVEDFKDFKNTGVEVARIIKKPTEDRLEHALRQIKNLGTMAVPLKNREERVA
jgi:hypothetical protein